MKEVPEAILAINLAILSCIVLIDIILRYGFQTSTLSVDESSRYLFVRLTFIDAVVAFTDNAHVQTTFLVEKLSPARQRQVALVTHSSILFIYGALAWGVALKTIQDWSNYSPVLGLPISLMHAACLSTSLVIALSGLRHLYQLITCSSSLTSPLQGA